VDSSTRIAHFIGDPLFCFADEFYSPQQGNLAEASAGGFHSLFRTLSGQVFATGGAPFTYFDNYLGFPVSVGWGQGAWDANGVEFEDAAASAYHEHLIPGLLATKVSAGWFHSAAIKQDGTVQCWGAGEARFMNPDDPTIALDQNYTPNFTQSMVPSGVKDCTDVSAGGFHTVALKDVNPATGVGTVVTWGNNGHGQGVLNGIASMAIDEEAVVFRRSNNDVIARGEPAQTDIEAAGPSDFITAGYGSTARLGSDGSLQFFGKLATLSAPIDPATGNPALLRSVAIGESHVLGIRPDGSVIAWGGPTCNNFLQCWSIRDESEWGSRNSVATVAPTRRSHKVPATNYDACITIAGVTSCVTQKSTPPEDPQGLVRFSGDLVSWNGNEANENPFSCCIPTTATLTTDRLLRAVQVAAGRTHSLALRQDGNLQAWGGVERTDDTFTIAKAVSDTPTAGLGVSYIKICAGRDHNIAMQVLGSAQVWGDNTFGQVSPQLPRQPGLLDFDVRDIAAGDRHTVILKSDGRVYAWGDETYSEVDGVIVATRNSNSPAEIPDNTFGVAVAAGGMNTALLRDRLEPRIIGALASLTLPTFSDTMPQAVAVRAGGFHTVVLLPNGAVQAWGAGQDGTADDMQVVGLSTFPNYGQSIPVMRGPDYTSTVKVVLPLSTSNPNPISAGALSTAVLQRRSDMTGPPFAQLTGGEGADGEDGPFPDFDSDGCVTTSDLAILLGEIGNGAWPGADLDGSGEIDMGDVALLQMRLGECLGVPLADAASAN
jgi:alpha-tubulin suppressor-like RCC1 family protein